MNIKCPKCAEPIEIDLEKYPPGQTVVVCKHCNAKFAIKIDKSIYHNARTRKISDVIYALECPYCKNKTVHTVALLNKSKLWRCPKCNKIFHVEIPEIILGIGEKIQSEINNVFSNSQKIETVSTPSQKAEVFKKTTDQPIQDSIQVTQIQDGSSTTDTSEQSQQIQLLSPLTEAEKYSGHFLVKMGNKIEGPMSFANVENWARTHIMKPGALIAIAQKDPEKFFPAELMPELRLFFHPEEQKPTNILKDLFNEPTPGEKVQAGLSSGFLGGIVTGFILSPIILFKLWTPIAIWSPFLQVLIFIGFMAITGIALGAVNSILERWILEYPWNVVIQVLITLIFTLIFFAVKAIQYGIKSSLITSFLVFIVILLTGLLVCQFHRRFEVVE